MADRSTCSPIRCRDSGITTTFVDPRDPDAFRAAIRPETRMVFGELLGNPGLEILDIEAVGEIAHEAGLPLVIDATFNTPYLCRVRVRRGHRCPFGNQVARRPRHCHGRRPDRFAGRLRLGRPRDKFPTLTEPYAGYHGIVFAEEYGPAAFIMRARAEGLRDFGAA